MRKITRIVVGSIVLALVLGIGGIGAIMAVSWSEERGVRTAVTEFGERLKNVSLTAEPSAVHESVQHEYAPYVATALLSQWEADVTKVPGRPTSSPWPEGIEIVNIFPLGETYFVEGTVSYVTSDSLVGEGPGIQTLEEVALVVAQEDDGAWKITDYTVKQSETSLDTKEGQ